MKGPMQLQGPWSEPLRLPSNDVQETRGVWMLTASQEGPSEHPYPWVAEAKASLSYLFYLFPIVMMIQVHATEQG